MLVVVLLVLLEGVVMIVFNQSHYFLKLFKQVILVFIQFHQTNHFLLKLFEFGVERTHGLLVRLNLLFFLVKFVQYSLDGILNQLTNLIHLDELMLAEVHSCDGQICVNSLVFTFRPKNSFRFVLVLLIIFITSTGTLIFTECLR